MSVHVCGTSVGRNEGLWCHHVCHKDMRNLGLIVDLRRTFAAAAALVVMGWGGVGAGRGLS